MLSSLLVLLLLSAGKANPSSDECSQDAEEASFIAFTASKTNEKANHDSEQDWGFRRRPTPSPPPSQPKYKIMFIGSSQFGKNPSGFVDRELFAKMARSVDIADRDRLNYEFVAVKNGDCHAGTTECKAAGLYQNALHGQLDKSTNIGRENWALIEQLECGDKIVFVDGTSAPLTTDQQFVDYDVKKLGGNKADASQTMDQSAAALKKVSEYFMKRYGSLCVQPYLMVGPAKPYPHPRTPWDDYGNCTGRCGISCFTLTSPSNNWKNCECDRYHERVDAVDKAYQMYNQEAFGYQAVVIPFANAVGRVERRAHGKPSKDLYQQVWKRLWGDACQEGGFKQDHMSHAIGDYLMGYLLVSFVMGVPPEWIKYEGEDQDHHSPSSDPAKRLYPRDGSWGRTNELKVIREVADYEFSLWSGL